MDEKGYEIEDFLHINRYGEGPQRTLMGGRPRCCGYVRGNGIYRHQCSKQGKLEEGGYTWCKTHHPQTVVAKRNARNAAWEKKWNARKNAIGAAYARQCAEQKVCEIAIKCLSQEATFDELMEAAEELSRLRG